MLWLPFLRRVEPALDPLPAGVHGRPARCSSSSTRLLEGIEIAGQGSQAFGGAAAGLRSAPLVAYLALPAVDALPALARPAGAGGGRAGGAYLALLVAIGIGLHNLGEGLAIGAAYAAGALALGALLVVGFAIHNTTEGLAIVAPWRARAGPGRPARGARPARRRPRRSSAPGSARRPSTRSVVAFLLGVGAGAIAQVIVQLAPFIRDEAGRHLHPRSAAGLVAGIGVLYLTSLLVTA